MNNKICRANFALSNTVIIVKAQRTANNVNQYEQIVLCG